MLAIIISFDDLPAPGYFKGADFGGQFIAGRGVNNILIRPRRQGKFLLLSGRNQRRGCHRAVNIDDQIEAGRVVENEEALPGQNRRRRRSGGDRVLARRRWGRADRGRQG